MSFTTVFLFFILFFIVIQCRKSYKKELERVTLSTEEINFHHKYLENFRRLYGSVKVPTADQEFDGYYQIRKKIIKKV